jgi:REP element-mobilizing transposase RayT
VSYVPKLSVSDLVRRLKGRSAKILLEEYSDPINGYLLTRLWGANNGALFYAFCRYFRQANDKQNDKHFRLHLAGTSKAHSGKFNYQKHSKKCLFDKL